MQKKKVLKVENDQLYTKCSIFKYSISYSSITLININILILEEDTPFKIVFL